MSTLPPKQPYPRLIWYQEKRLPCTPEERDILFKRCFDISIERIEKIFPNSYNDKSKIDLASEKANKMVDAEINLPTIMRKVQVKTAEEHILTKQIIEDSDNFLQWYQE